MKKCYEYMNVHDDITRFRNDSRHVIPGEEIWHSAVACQDACDYCRIAKAVEIHRELRKSNRGTQKEIIGFEDQPYARYLRTTSWPCDRPRQ
jgi:hypothetical protein